MKQNISICNFFFREKLSPCTVCNRMFYCTKVCQVKDWEYHWRECRLYKNQYEAIGNFRCRFLLRLYHTIEFYPDKRTKTFLIPNTRPEQYKTYDDLPRFNESQSVDEQANIFNLFMDIRGSLEEAGLNENDHYYFDKLQEHFFKMMTNIISIQDEDTIDYAGGIFVAPSLLSKSSDPNSCLITNGLMIEIYALKNILPGEEITINSDPVILSRRNRLKIRKGTFLNTGDEEGKFFIIF